MKKISKVHFIFLSLAIVFAVIVFRSSSVSRQTQRELTSTEFNETIISGSFDPSKSKSEEEWKKVLTPKQYHILREAGTEIAFTGDLLKNEAKGTYYSVGCDQPVFRSEDKYESGTGWPSFTKPISNDALVLREEKTLGFSRTEVLDSCGSHLGHVFDDGPLIQNGVPTTGKRYCMNSVALYFVPDQK